MNPLKNYNHDSGIDGNLCHTLEISGIPYAAQISLIEGVTNLQNMCYYLSKRSGWWTVLDSVSGTPAAMIDPCDPNVFSCKIALIHSEISEALEGGRKDKMDDHLPDRKSEEVELADAVIRIMDLAGARGLDLAGAIIEKLAYNQSRPDHKPENRAAAGGKKF